MTYYLAKTISGPFDQALERTERALQNEGFGIITRVDIRQTLREKLGEEFRNYQILGACNPKAAHEALQLEDKVGTMLPCNVVVQEVGADEVEVAAIDPVASMQAIENEPLLDKARAIREKLQNAITSL